MVNGAEILHLFCYFLLYGVSLCVVMLCSILLVARLQPGLVERLLQRPQRLQAIEFLGPALERPLPLLEQLLQALRSEHGALPGDGHSQQLKCRVVG